MIKKPKLNYMGNVGFIGNYFTEQLLSHDFTVRLMDMGLCERIVVDYNIDVVFIDAEFFNIDNSWSNMKLEELINYMESLDLNIILVSYSNEIIDNRFFHLFINNKPNNEFSGNNHMIISYKINEKIFNPINTKKKQDLLILSDEDELSEIESDMGEGLYKHFKDKKRNYNLYNINDISRNNLIKLNKEIKKTKAVFIPNPEKINRFILQYLDLICAVQNTFLIINSSDQYNTEYSLVSDNENTLIHTIQRCQQQGILNDHSLIKRIRSTLLNHSFLRSNNLYEVINMENTSIKPIKISVVTSTVRKTNLENYIDQLNQQNYVELEIILLTHGFELSVAEKNKLQNLSINPIKFLNESSNVVYGKCLNICLENMNYDFFAKIDDDDFYYPNYLIDSWISLQYSDASIVGKHSTFWYLQDYNLVAERFYSQSQKYTKYIAGATLFCNTKFIRKYQFSLLASGVDYDLLERINYDKKKIYCSSPYEFCVFRNSDVNSHTWKVDNLYLLRSASIRFFGTPSESLSVNNN